MINKFVAVTLMVGMTTGVATAAFAGGATQAVYLSDRVSTYLLSQSNDGGIAVDRTVALLPDGLKPNGFDIGSFKLLPRLTLSATQQGNIFATEAGEVSGQVNTVIPEVELISQWPRHSLEFAANLTAVNYPDNSTENFTSNVIGTYGRYDFGEKHNLFVNLTHARASQPRSQEGADNLFNEPIRFSNQNAEIGVTLYVDRFKLTASGANIAYDYDDAYLDNGTKVSQEFRNRDENYANLRAEYVINAEGVVYVAYSQNEKDYEADVPKRSSQGHETAIGFSYALSDRLDIGFQIGQGQQTYDNRLAGDTDYTSYLGELSWVATKKTRLHLVSKRSLQETSVKTSTGYLSTASGLSIERWLLPNLVLTSSFNRAENDYQIIDRIDSFDHRGLGLNWYLTRNIILGLDYDSTSLTSKGAQATLPFDDETIGVSLGLSY